MIQPRPSSHCPCPCPKRSRSNFTRFHSVLSVCLVLSCLFGSFFVDSGASFGSLRGVSGRDRPGQLQDLTPHLEAIRALKTYDPTVPGAYDPAWKSGTSRIVHGLKEGVEHQFERVLDKLHLHKMRQPLPSVVHYQVRSQPIAIVSPSDLQLAGINKRRSRRTTRSNRRTNDVTSLSSSPHRFNPAQADSSYSDSTEQGANSVLATSPDDQEEELSIMSKSSGDDQNNLTGQENPAAAVQQDDSQESPNSHSNLNSNLWPFVPLELQQPSRAAARDAQDNQADQSTSIPPLHQSDDSDPLDSAPRPAASAMIATAESSLDADSELNSQVSSAAQAGGLRGAISASPVFESDSAPITVIPPSAATKAKTQQRYTRR